MYIKIFYFGRTDSDSQIYDNNVYVKNYTYLGTVEDITEDGLIRIHQKNKFCVGDSIGFMLFEGANKEVYVDAIYDEKMLPQESAPHPKQLIYVKLSDIEGIKKGMIIRLKECSS